MTTEPQDSTQRDFGVQPIVELMAKHEIERHDLVAASTEQITHKMVARACKGRRLTKNVQQKIRAAMNAAANSQYSITDLFNYK